MPRVKTAASERSVPMLPSLHEILLTQSAERRSRKAPAFLTRNGTRQHPDNIRARLLAGVLLRANTLLADRDEQPIPHMTPHTLRRTFASLLAEIRVSPRRAMYLLGHTDPKVHDARLPTGPGPRRSALRAARAGAWLHGRRRLLAPFGAGASNPRSTGRAPRRFAPLTGPVLGALRVSSGGGVDAVRKQDRTHVEGLPVVQEPRGLDNEETIRAG